MKVEPTTLIILGVLCVALGFIANVLLGMLREDTEPEGRPDDSVDSAPPGGRKGKYTPVVRLWRERQTGKMVVEVDGKSLVTSEPLTEIQRDRLEKAARDFRAFLGMGLAGRNIVLEPEPQPVETPAPPMPQQAAPNNQAAPVNQAAPAPTAPSQPVGTPAPSRVATPAPLARPAAKPAGGKQKSEPSPVEEAAAAVSSSKSIVAQIEDILQDMLAGGPLANRGIHLTEDPLRGVIVSDGVHLYEGIDSVPDPEVKAIIRSAVAEWEKSQA